MADEPPILGYSSSQTEQKKRWTATRVLILGLAIIGGVTWLFLLIVVVANVVGC